jgi:hypothetical protein
MAVHTGRLPSLIVRGRCRTVAAVNGRKTGSGRPPRWSPGRAYWASLVAGRSGAWRLKSRIVRATSSGSSLIGT